MASIITIADALVTGLNAASLGQTFTAGRLYRPIRDLKDTTDLLVTVVPREQELTLADRAQGQYDVAIDIGIQKKLTTASNAEIDPLMTFVESMIDYIRAQRSFSAGRFLRITNQVIYAPEHLSEQRTFTSILTVTLRAYRK